MALVVLSLSMINHNSLVIWHKLGFYPSYLLVIVVRCTRTIILLLLTVNWPLMCFTTRTHCVQISFLVSYENGTAKMIPTQGWMRQLFHQNFVTNSLVCSDLVLFAFGNYDLTILSWYFLEDLSISAKDQGIF